MKRKILDLANDTGNGVDKTPPKDTYESMANSVARTVNDAVITIDTQGMITFWNPAAQRIFGYESEEVLGKNVTVLIPKKYVGLHRVGLKKAVSTGEQMKSGQTVEVEAVRKNGETFPMEMSLARWDRGDGMMAFTGVIRDISVRKQQEAQIKEQNLELEKITHRLSKYLSPQIYDSIFAGEEKDFLATKRKKLTLFFSDLENFTKLSEDMAPEDLTNFINHYFTEMCSIAFKYGATVDKFIGDSLVIFFGDPNSRGVEEDARQCILMALEMREKVLSLKEYWKNVGIVSPPNVRIGIHSGFCSVGNFGSETRMEYTVIGNSVNLASRLEQSARKNAILISEETHALVRDHFEFEECGEVQPKGIRRQVRTYEVIRSLSHDEMSNRFSFCDEGLVLNVDVAALDKKQKIKLSAKLDELMRLLKNEPPA